MAPVELPEVVERGYRRLKRLAGWACYLPQGLWPHFARLGVTCHPFAGVAAEFAQGCVAGLGVAPSVANEMARRHLRRHVLAYFRSTWHGEMTAHWWRGAVTVDAASNVFETLLQEGGLVLTCHVPEYHLLAVMLGQARREMAIAGGIYPVVMSERQSPYYLVVADYLHKLHEDTARYFNEGRYVFLEPNISRTEDVANLIETSAIVVVLNDNYNYGSRVQPDFFGRPHGVRSGAVRLALSAGRPIYWAWWQAGESEPQYRLRLDRLQGATPEAILGDYSAKLVANVRAAPDAWDGWRWFPHSSPIRRMK